MKTQDLSRSIKRIYRSDLIGAGAPVFAVWGYVTAHVRRDGAVDLHPKLIAGIVGGEVAEANAAIEKLVAAGFIQHSRGYEYIVLTEEQ